MLTKVNLFRSYFTPIVGLFAVHVTDGKQYKESGHGYGFDGGFFSCDFFPTKQEQHGHRNIARFEVSARLYFFVIFEVP